MESVLIERHEAVQNARAVFSKAHYKTLLKSETPLRLVELAEEQHRLPAA